MTSLKCPCFFKILFISEQKSCLWRLQFGTEKGSTSNNKCCVCSHHRLTSPCLTSLRTYILCSKTQYSKTSAQIRTYYADDTFKFLNYCDQDLRFDLLVQIWKQRAREGAAEDPNAKPKKRTMTALKLTVELRLIQTGFKVPEDTGFNIIDKLQN